MSMLLVQFNPLVGAVSDNAQRIKSIINQHANHHLIVFPELALCGYPPEDLLLREELFQRTHHELMELAQVAPDKKILIGHPRCENGLIYNSVSLLHEGHIKATYDKQHLPNYGVFDERRYFEPGSGDLMIFEHHDKRFGVLICEDIWVKGPVNHMQALGVTDLICINASPFDEHKYQKRLELLNNHSKKGLNIYYVNQVGGQDELVFDGLSLVINSKQRMVARAKAFEEDYLSISLSSEAFEQRIEPLPEPLAMIYQALVLGTRDYVNKNKFNGVLLGLSGGIDSALTLAIAVDAIGANRVCAVLMPSRYTSDISLEDALAQLKTMQVAHQELSIEPAFNALLDTLAPSFLGKEKDTTEENLQARIRGMILMALSNKHGQMVLTTSNKSETAVGYSTLYGDMAGGFAPLKDVLKTKVYALAAWRNEQSLIIPSRVLTRAPSAELAENQTDQDSLPEYSLLDEIIRRFVEHNQSASDMIADGIDKNTVLRVIGMIQRNEYKRRQSAPGIKISTRAFDRDWRQPITSGF